MQGQNFSEFIFFRDYALGEGYVGTTK